MSLPDVLKSSDVLKSDESTPSSPRNRRDFLRTVAGGAAAGAAVTAAGCDSAGGGGGNQSPTAFFSVQPEEEESLTITFNAGDSEDPDGSIADYSWDFGGDGKRAQSEEESESDETVTYTYARPGVYEVRLVVADRRGGVARTTQQVTAGSVDTGEGPVPLNLDTDLGVLNYAYALEQLEAAFYARVLDEGTFSGSAEAVMSDLAAHEDIHRLTLGSVLQTAAIRDLTPDFGDVDFNSTGSVLSTAQTLEVLGVSAYNGAADLLSSAEFLGAAGSIVSVEARHAAAVRDLAGASDHFFSGPFPVGGGFAIDDDGLYEARDPREVLDAAAPYIEERFDVQGG